VGAASSPWSSVETAPRRRRDLRRVPQARAASSRVTSASRPPSAVRRCTTSSWCCARAAGPARLRPADAGAGSGPRTTSSRRSTDLNAIRRLEVLIVGARRRSIEDTLAVQRGARRPCDRCLAPAGDLGRPVTNRISRSPIWCRRRAPTPSAAAEIAVPRAADLAARVEALAPLLSAMRCAPLRSRARPARFRRGRVRGPAPADRRAARARRRARRADRAAMRRRLQTTRAASTARATPRAAAPRDEGRDPDARRRARPRRGSRTGGGSPPARQPARVTRAAGRCRT